MLLSDDYRRLLVEYHKANPEWGASGFKYAAHIQSIASQYRCKQILDYGCGKGSLGKQLFTTVVEYDPGIPGKSEPPQRADMVVSTDVLEHVEPACVTDVLDHIRSLTKKVGWHAIALRKDRHILPDGRTSHLTVRPAAWWKEHLRNAGFRVEDCRHPANAPRYEEVCYTCLVYPV